MGGKKTTTCIYRQGVAMLAGMLNTEIAIDTSIKIINAFVRMRHYINNNELMLSNVESKIIEHKENNLLNKRDIEMYNRQYSNLKIIYDNTFHDRFFILDNNILYHCGTSVNRIGYKSFAINLFTDLEPSKLLINRINKIVEKCVDFKWE